MTKAQSLVLLQTRQLLLLLLEPYLLSLLSLQSCSLIHLFFSPTLTWNASKFASDYLLQFVHLKVDYTVLIRIHCFYQVFWMPLQFLCQFCCQLHQFSDSMYSSSGSFIHAMLWSSKKEVDAQLLLFELSCHWNLSIPWQHCGCKQEYCSTRLGGSCSSALQAHAQFLAFFLASNLTFSSIDSF